MEWNVVASVKPGRFRQVLDRLRRLGEVARTGYYNVLVARVEDGRKLLEALREGEGEPGKAVLARLVPAGRTFTFRSQDEFEARVREAAMAWLPSPSLRGSASTSASSGAVSRAA